MIKASKRRIQRAFRYTAPLHLRQHFVHAHLDKALKSKLGLSIRSIRVAKGDTVKIVAGKNKGKSGKVSKVDLSRGVIYLDSLVRKNARGKERAIPVKPSSVYVMDIETGYKGRLERLKQAHNAVQAST
ncbi:MAG: 50S ribosomal protein L24 [Candidatus Micrarchaeaceae archaeon]